jgi:hypothetical protein
MKSRGICGNQRQQKICKKGLHRFPKPSIPVQFRAGVPIFASEKSRWKKILALAGDSDNMLAQH